MMLKNAVVVFVTTVLNIILGLIETRVFLAKYGADINGLIQSGNQLTQYLALIEGGICSAYMYNMYQAIAKHDKAGLSAFYNGFRRSIARIVEIMFVVATIVSLVYPLLLGREKIGYLTMTSVFLLLFSRAIMPYWITLVPKQMIILREQKYKAELIAGLTNSAVFWVEIIIALYTDFSIQSLLFLCVCVSFTSGIIYRVTMKKLYCNELDLSANPNFEPRGMSKDIIPHTISGLIFNSTDSVVLSVFASLRDVTIYSNYSMLIRYAGSVSDKLTDGATATLGIKIARKDKDAFGIFKKIFILVSFFTVFVASAYMLLINDFITLWVGKQYCVNSVDVCLFAVVLYCNMLLPSMQALVSASGLFKESKGFIMFQAAVNLILTLILTPQFGITGALIGTVVARIFITVPLNYRMVYKYVFNRENTEWGKLTIPPLITILLVFFLSKMIAYINLTETLTISFFIIKTLVVSLLIGGILLIVFSIGFPDFRDALLYVKRKLFSK